MSKYQINYSRVAPDHRVPWDYTFVKKTQTPLDYMKQWKQGFNTSWLKYYQIHIAGLWIVLLGGVSLAMLWNRNPEEMLRDKVGKYPALHFIKQYEKGNFAPYDNILSKFATDPSGNKDQPFSEY